MAELIEGAYYYTENGIEQAHFCIVNGVKKIVTPKTQVFDSVPSFERWAPLQEDVDYFQGLAKEQFKDIKKLRQLLKDVRNLWKGTVFMPETQEQVRDVLTRINAAIGESEE